MVLLLLFWSANETWLAESWWPVLLAGWCTICVFVSSYLTSDMVRNLLLPCHFLWPSSSLSRMWCWCLANYTRSMCSWWTAELLFFSPASLFPDRFLGTVCFLLMVSSPCVINYPHKCGVDVKRTEALLKELWWKRKYNHGRLDPTQWNNESDRLMTKWRI